MIETETHAARLMRPGLWSSVYVVSFSVWNAGLLFPCASRCTTSVHSAATQLLGLLGLVTCRSASGRVSSPILLNKGLGEQLFDCLLGKAFAVNARHVDGQGSIWCERNLQHDYRL